MRVKLGEVATYINGYAFKPSDWSDTGVPIIRIQDLTGNSYQANRYNGTYDKKYEVLPSDVLISWSASLGVYVWDGEPAVLNQHIFKVVFNKCPVDKSFFVHQVRSILMRAASAAHGATMKHLTKPVFDALPFYLPRLEEQRRIAAVLDKVTDLIAKRQAQLDKLDELVKARFMEMFGDPEINSLKLPSCPMPNLCEIIDGDRGSNYPKQEDLSSEGYCLFLNAKNVTSSGFCFDECLYISKEKDSVMRKGKLRRGDIVLTTRGTIGNLAFYDHSIPFENVRINSGMVLLRIHKDQITEIFFIEQFRILLNYIKRKIANGSAQPQLPISTMRQIKMLVPPLKDQATFNDIVIRSQTLKSNIDRSLNQMKNVKKSIMQKYFE